MSKLLIDDKPVMVLPKLAIEIGLNEAVVLQQIHYWIETYKDANKQDHFHEGKWWVYNTKQEWQVNFPWWSENTVWRALTGLRELGLVLTTSKYNKKGYDKTLWYTIDYKKLEAIEKSLYPKWVNGDTQNGKMDVPKMGTPIPETISKTNPEISSPPSLPIYDDNGELAPLEDRIIEVFCDRVGLMGSERPYENNPSDKKWYADWLKDVTKLMEMEVSSAEMEEAIALLLVNDYPCKRPGALIETLENMRKDRDKFDRGERNKLHRYRLEKRKDPDDNNSYFPVDWWQEKAKGQA